MTSGCPRAETKGEQLVSANGYRISFEDNESVINLDRSGDYTTLNIQNPFSCTLKMGQFCGMWIISLNKLLK